MISYFLKGMARRIAEVSAECKLPISVNDYVDKFKSVVRSS